MHPRSELTMHLARLALAAALTGFGATGAMAQAPAEDASVWPCADEEEVDVARTVAVLTALAEAGHVGAMERLGLMHWYGERLYGSGPWGREVALQWFERASARGSEVGLHMLAVADRGVTLAKASR
ncbi:MAG: hypothetical protein HXY24_05650 [Rubrivivax sp.]|nr:hypothetical protein [Rubrivivax sp.]